MGYSVVIRFAKICILVLCDMKQWLFANPLPFMLKNPHFRRAHNNSEDHFPILFSLCVTMWWKAGLWMCKSSKGLCFLSSGGNKTP